LNKSKEVDSSTTELKHKATKKEKTQKKHVVERAKSKPGGPSQKNDVETSQALVKEAQQLYHQGRSGEALWCGVVQCVAVCCSVLQCVAACCSELCMLQVIRMRMTVWQRICM